MKKILLMLALTLGTISYSQEVEFTFTTDGLTDYVITQCEGKTESEIYKKCIEWIKINYNNPNEVILSTIEDKFIRFQGSGGSGLVKYYRHGGIFTPDSRYIIELSIKEGKYKFDLINLETYSGTVWHEADCFFSRNKNCYNSKGEFKKDYKFYNEISDYFNKINLSLKEKVLGSDEKW
ncbi:hypothetical protein ACFX5D_01355 [Flavobacterium sp. LB3P45]|uniref:DUF4468 domain-containing protein n=1 Tax=Flavobacterium fructosi TaxID=3230416 RepID=A0ABW6HIQ0_9FLAO